MNLNAEVRMAQPGGRINGLGQALARGFRVLNFALKACARQPVFPAGQSNFHATWGCALKKSAGDGSLSRAFATSRSGHVPVPGTGWISGAPGAEFLLTPFSAACSRRGETRLAFRPGACESGPDLRIVLTRPGWARGRGKRRPERVRAHFILDCRFNSIKQTNN
jgi:hypothetical protein